MVIFVHPQTRAWCGVSSILVIEIQRRYQVRVFFVEVQIVDKGGCPKLALVMAGDGPTILEHELFWTPVVEA